ncbi:polysaccharide pyruvyl transferase [Isoptericola sp. CG 20/1183]|uniref:Polysaccharide pyruvyl transferase n=1 Tax=Isoptericola halotolerans TaxID=300560 RepID=A0ABX5EDW1_9MICO|nr:MULTISPECIES: polysaccharide pyruvyl transferase family protein [Isoptericola]PRZ06537.1 polysaccharide pyruvyl transferase [Isoptericola halotolerans]PRZ06657.1 polysaccharide pyruvyl transferase [Isoptericola sp. CG 20/1183]
MTADGAPFAELLDRADELSQDAHYEGALEVLAVLAGRPGVFASSRYVFLLSRVLRATSRYDAANDVLALLRRDAFLVSRAETERAQIAWIRHQYEQGVEHAVHAVRANPGNAAAHAVLRRVQAPITPSRASAPTGGVAHAAFYVSDGGNFGDLALPVAVRAAFVDARGPVDWLPVHVHQLFDEERLELTNAQRALVVGGGGLFLPDTSPNGNSGWQWNVPRAMLERIEVPVAAYAVGFNLFKGQTFHGDLFRSNLEAFAEQVQFLGLRNHGSVGRVREMLPPRLQDKVRFVPCPTTVLQRTRTGLPPAEAGTGRVLVNAAYDRSSRRFGGGYESFLAGMESFIAQLSASGAEVRFASHLPGDERFVRDIAAQHGRELPVDRLNLMSPEEGFAYYRRASLVVGMRGHASMIPFGLGTPILSIVSHPKMRYFLEDIGRPEWAFDVDRPDLGNALTVRARDVLQHEQRYRADVADLQAMLHEPIEQAAVDLLASASVQDGQPVPS